MIPKRRRPPRLSGSGLDGLTQQGAPSPQLRGPRWFHSGGGPLASAAGAFVIPKSKRSPRLCSGGLGDPKAEETPRLSSRGLGGPKAKEAPPSQRRGPR